MPGALDPYVVGNSLADIACPRPQLDAHDLRNYLATFIEQNRDSTDVNHRWLAEHATDLKNAAYNVKAGSSMIRDDVNQFRLREIKAEREKLAKQDRVLEDEAMKLTIASDSEKHKKAPQAKSE